MKKIWLIAPAFLFSLAAAQAQRVIMNTRFQTGNPALTRTEKTQVLRETRAFLNLPRCTGGEVMDKATGSFTRARARQTAYLVNNCAGSTIDPSNTEFGRLVIYEKGRIVRAVKNIGHAIGNVGDVNRDGVDDLLFLTFYGPQMGETGTNASVITLKNNAVRTFLDLNDAEQNTCDAPVGDRSRVAHRVTVQPGATPIFTDNVYVASCKAGAPFRLIGTKRL